MTIDFSHIPEYPLHTIAILGGTGSLGHALTRFLLEHTQATIRIFSRDEDKQESMAIMFCAQADRLRFLLGDIRDLPRLQLALRNVDCVFHAAALKRIPQGEYNSSEHVRTNIYGTENIIQACISTGVRTAAFISSDKAVAAINLYGMTKAVGERLWLQGNSYTPEGTRFVALRYGNVAQSRGSVLEVWRNCLTHNQPLPLTDPCMTRFFLTLPDAVRYAWYTALRVPRGCLFVPHLPTFATANLLAAVAPDAYVRVVGMRPGEKRDEILMTDDERLRARVVLGANGELFGYIIPPIVHSWPIDEALLPDEPTQPIEPYISKTWGWKLGVEELRMRLKGAE